jgi:DNA polymerase-3 subunit gamma/tau
MLSTGAFNALLKTLEEPPEHVVFILATTEQHKIPVTILSRCQKYKFKLIPSKEIALAIKNIAAKENFEIDDDALNIVINASGGSMRDALSLLDQAVSSSRGKISAHYIRGLLGLLPKEIIAGVSEDLAKGNIQKILETVKNISEQGYNVLQFARDLRDHLRQVMIYSVNPEIAEISTDDKKLFESQKALFPVSRHIRMNNLISKALEEMRWHDQPRILLEMYLLKMSEPYYNVGELINKVAELEKNLQSSGFSASAPLANASVSDDLSNLSAGDLINIWKEIVSEITKKHQLTSGSLAKAAIKVLSPSSVQLSVESKFDYDGVMEFHEQIAKLYQRKTGTEISVKAAIEKIAPAQEEEEIIVSQDTPSQSETESPTEYAVEEDLKETAKTAVPKHIEEIAKKLGGTAKKIK